MQFNPNSSPRYRVLLKIAQVFRPELLEMTPERQVIAVGDVIGIIVSAPILIASLVILVLKTEWGLFSEHSITFLIFTALMLVFSRLRFFFITELRTNRYGSSVGSLIGVISWCAVFLYGATAIWLPILIQVIRFLLEKPPTENRTGFWSFLRNVAMDITGDILILFVGILVYSGLGGKIPIEDASIRTLIAGLAALGSSFIVLTILWGGFMLYNSWVQEWITGFPNRGRIFRFFFFAVGLPILSHPFGILAAYLYSQNDLIVFLFFMTGMVIVAYISRLLSMSMEGSRQQSRQLERLEALGRALLNAPPDKAILPNLLNEYVPNMFPAGRLIIWIFPEGILYKHPSDWKLNLEEIWLWLLSQKESQTFMMKDTLPWDASVKSHNPIIVAPIYDIEHDQTFGGLYLELHTLVEPWNKRSLKMLCPAIQALCAQIASSYNQSKVYNQALQFQRVSDELRLAGNIQLSLLPSTFPKLPGWEIAVTLHPAGETSGDFFDIIPLEDGKVGIVIADVMDKGIGPAIYMTLSRTLIRTFATEFDEKPDVVFYAVNERILKDTSANLFVTAFYGILDPETGILTYANAGHNPPYLFRSGDGGNAQSLNRTGVPVGIDSTTWESVSVQLDPGDVLVLYTDGVPDAQNSDQEFFKESSLVDIARENLGNSAEEIQRSILDSVYAFIGDAAQFDDITLMILSRDRE